MSVVLYSSADRIGVITLNRPDARNAVDREVARGLEAAVDGGLFRLPRAVGRAAAMDASLTGEPIGAGRAFDLGLVSRLVEPGAALDELLASEDASEGLHAFAEKRQPHWQSR